MAEDSITYVYYCSYAEDLVKENRQFDAVISLEVWTFFIPSYIHVVLQRRCLIKNIVHP
jgi:2-polyprenyl-3-methyl-5-hydroxy-6-metoxy-1,4-benzoquinol methylase